MSRSEVTAQLKERGINRGLTTLKVEVLRDLLTLIQEGDSVKSPKSKAEVARSDVFGRISQDGIFRIIDRRRSATARGKMPQYMATDDLRDVLSFLGWEVPELKWKEQLAALAVARLKAQGMVLDASGSNSSRGSTVRSASPARSYY